VLTAIVNTNAYGRMDTELFKVTITDKATGAFKVELLDNVLHTGGPNDEATDATAVINYTITDADGSPVTGNTLTITFDDDAPTATDGSDSVEEGHTATGTFAFVAGADGASVTHINGQALTFGEEGWSQWIDVDHGRVQAKADGSYKFEADDAVVGEPEVVVEFTVTDGDGDTVTADFTFQIEDANTPTAGSAVAAVDDDGLLGGNPASTTGDLNANAGDDPSDTSEATFTGTLGGSVGDDGAGANGFTFGSNLPATVGLEQVRYEVSPDGTVLTAIVNTNAYGRMDTELFKVTITDKATGAFKVELLTNVLHTGGPNDEATDATAVINYTITDADGSPVTGNTLTITFDDDAPTLAETNGPEFLTVLNEADAFAAGSFSANFGADGAHSYKITGPEIDGVAYDDVNNVRDDDGNLLYSELVARPEGGGDAIFKLVVKPDGNYEFHLLEPKAGTEETIDLSKLNPGGPVPWVELPGTQANPEQAGRIEFTANGNGVNASNQGFGVSNQWTSFGEWFQLEFHDPGTPGNDPAHVNAEVIQGGFEIGVNQVNGTSATFKYTVYLYNDDGTLADGYPFSDEVELFAGEETMGIFPPVPFSVLHIEHVGGDPVRFTSEITITRTILPPDVTYEFEVVGVDGDGDESEPIEITVFIDEPATPPVVLDLDGDGVEFLSQAAGVAVDYLGDGPRATAWVGPDDGLLAIDANGNGRVDGASEFVFGGNGLTDLQAIAAKYDTNGDGVLDAQDADFSRFGVWQDANSNGVSDEGEFRSLTEAGIVSINLQSDGQAYTAADGDVKVHGQSSYKLADGTERTLADASFTYGKPGSAYNSALRTGTAAADALVAASLITMATAAAAQNDTEDEPTSSSSSDAPFAPVTDAASDAGDSDASRHTFDEPERTEVADDTPANDSGLSGDYEDAAPAGLQDDGNDTASGSDTADADTGHSSDALFDAALVPPAASPAMDGLLALAAPGPDAGAENEAGADAATVLAEALDNGGLDQLIDAVTDGSQPSSDQSNADVDLAQILDTNVGTEAAVYVHQPIENDLNQMAAA